jgi:TP901 family phage tail tape measure protein
MSAQVKSITLRAGYESSLKERLQQDIAAIKSFKRNLEKNPIKVPIRLDLSGIRADATRAANEYKKAMGAALSSVKAGGGGVSKGGIILPASAMSQLKDFERAAKGTYKNIYREAKDGTREIKASFANLQSGLVERTNFKKGSKGKTVSSREITESLGLAKFEKDLADIRRKFAGRIGKAKGSGGDVAALLRQQQDEMADVLSGKNIRSDKSLSSGKMAEALERFAGIKDTPAFKKADNSLDRLEEKIESLTGTQNKRSERQVRAGRMDDLKDRLLAIDNALSGQLGNAQGSRGDVAKVLSDKRARIANELASFQDIADSPAFKQASNSIVALDKQIAAAVPRQDRAAEKEKTAMRSKQLQQRLLSIDTAMSGQIGSAKGNRGDVARLLEQKRNRIANELASFADIANSPSFKQAQKTINTLTKQIEEAVPKQARQQENTKRKDYNKLADRVIQREDNRMKRIVEHRGKALEAEARAIPDKARREHELNRILDQRERILERQIARYRRLEQAAAAAGQAEASSRLRNAGNRLTGSLEQVRLDRRRETARGGVDATEAALKRRLDTAERTYRITLAQIKAEEALARASKNRAERERGIREADLRRQQLRRNILNQTAGVWRDADRTGNTGIKRSSEKFMTGVEKDGIATMSRMAAATNKSGHAFNFHTTSLLKNAATFTRWYVPAQAAMGLFRAFGVGMRNAIAAERTFKILDAVFRGTEQESAKLAEQTLALAAANGRSSQEAADAAVAWARMGMTRTQVLVAMESSLRAANVAEIDAAEATAYLTANYKAFGQTIADIPQTLDYINALSNKNPVAPKEIFEGLARSAAVAREAGLSMQETAAIITTVAATTQRPGAEIGNSLKTIMTRLRRPQTTRKLESEFGYDIRTAEGDAKKMSQVLSELAAMYPGLSRMEKARLKDIVAGAHQGNRFAIVMETWNESLAAQAEAGLEANSAMKENAKILDSVSAKLGELSTNWTRLFHTMGEAGLFDFLGDAISDAGLLIDMLGRLGNTGSYGGGEDQPIRKRFSMLESFAAYSSGTATRMRNLDPRFREMSDNEARFAASNLSRGRLTKGIGDSMLSKIMNDGRSTMLANEAARLAQDSTQTRGALEGGAAAAQFFENASKAFGGRGISNDMLLKNFDRITEALASAEEFAPGGAIARQARSAVRPMLAAGDVEGARAGLADLAYSTRESLDEAGADYTSRTTAGLQTVEKALEEVQRRQETLQATLAKTGDEKTQERLQGQLAKTNDAVVELTDKARTLREEFSMPPVSPFTDEMKARMTDFIKEMTMAADVYGGLLDKMGSSGFSNLDASLAKGRVSMARNMMAQIVEATEAQNETLDSADQATIERLMATRQPGTAGAVDRTIDDIRRRMDLRRESLGAARVELSTMEESLPEALRRAEMERQAAATATAYDDTRRSTASGFSRYEIGQSEGSRMAARTGGILQELRADVADPFMGSGDSTSDARELAGMTERMAGVKEGLLTMEDRINRALAERVNLESEITEQNRRQNEEAARSLAMAGREDQLRAASAAAVLRARGQSQFSMEEFQYFSQETRGSIANFMPRGVKGLDSNEQSQAESRSILDREIAGLAVSLKAMRESFAALLPDAEAKAAGIIDLENPLGKKAPTANRVVDLDKEKVALNLNTGPIHISLDFSRHVQSIRDSLQATFDTRFAAEFARIRAMFTQSLDPNTAAAVGAW